MNTSIRFKVLLTLFLVVWGISLTLGSFSYFLLRKSSVRTEQQRFELQARHLNKDFHSYIQFKISTLESIARGREFADFSSTSRDTALNAYLTKFRNEFPVLAFIDEKGRERMVSQGEAGPTELLDLSSSKIFRTALSFPDEPTVLPIASAPHLGKPGLVFILHKRGHSGDRFVGILVGVVPYETLLSTFMHFDLADSSFIMAVDPHGVIIERTANAATLTMPRDTASAYKILLSSLPAKSSRGNQQVKLRGIDNFIAFDRGKGPGWVFIAGQPYDKFMRAPWKLQKLFLMITAGILVLGALLARFLANHLTRPIIEMSMAINTVSEGENDQAVEKKGKDELGQLASCFHAMTRNLKQTSISRDYLNSILVSMNEALIITSVDLVIQRCNEATETLFGYAASELEQRSICSLFPPDAAVISQITDDPGALSAKHFEVACLARNGKTMDTLATLSSFSPVAVTRDRQTPIYIWTFIDISERKKAEKALQNSQLYLKTLMTTMLVGIVVIDPETHLVIDCNDAALETLGRGRPEVIGRECHDYICPQHCGECPITDLGQEIDRSERSVINAAGETVPVLKSVKRLTLDHSELLVEAFVDISDRKRMEEELKKSEAKMRHIAITDELTGLLNRRGFRAMAEQQVARAKRMNDAIFLLYADLDNLKWINDTLGHEAGDRAIKEAARILQQTFRKVDTIGRLGGDEFAVLMTDTEQNYNPNTVNARLMRHIEILNGKEGRAYELSMSIGTIFCENFATCSFEELLSKADNKMYENKMKKKYKEQLLLSKRAGEEARIPNQFGFAPVADGDSAESAS